MPCSSKVCWVLSGMYYWRLRIDVRVTCQELSFYRGPGPLFIGGRVPVAIFYIIIGQSLFSRLPVGSMLFYWIAGDLHLCSVIRFGIPFVPPMLQVIASEFVEFLHILSARMITIADCVSGQPLFLLFVLCLCSRQEWLDAHVYA